MIKCSKRVIIRCRWYVQIVSIFFSINTNRRLWWYTSLYYAYLFKFFFGRCAYLTKTKAYFIWASEHILSKFVLHIWYKNIWYFVFFSNDILSAMDNIHLSYRIYAQTPNVLHTILRILMFSVKKKLIQVYFI